MSNIKSMSLAVALAGKEDLIIDALQNCLQKATMHLSDEEFSKAFVPEKFSHIQPEKLLLAA